MISKPIGGVVTQLDRTEGLGCSNLAMSSSCKRLQTFFVELVSVSFLVEIQTNVALSI